MKCWENKDNKYKKIIEKSWLASLIKTCRKNVLTSVIFRPIKWNGLISRWNAWERRIGQSPKATPDHVFVCVCTPCMCPSTHGGVVNNTDKEWQCEIKNTKKSMTANPFKRRHLKDNGSFRQQRFVNKFARKHYWTFFFFANCSICQQHSWALLKHLCIYLFAIMHCLPFLGFLYCLSIAMNIRFWIYGQKVQLRLSGWEASTPPKK